MAVEVLAGPVVPHRGPRIGMAGGDLDIPQVDAWAAPRFPDSRIEAISCCELPVQVLVMGFLRSPVAECRMRTSPIIPELDVRRNIFSCLSSRRVNGAVDTLNFHRGIE